MTNTSRARTFKDGTSAEQHGMILSRGKVR
jgi:hypothetical protein